MTGGLMQLVAFGAQDIYLTGNPTITYFKCVYRRHTNFAIETIEQTFNGATNFGSKVRALINRSGDLINTMYLEFKLPHLRATGNGTSWVNSLGHYLISQVDIEIGGQLIDRHYSDWLEIWAQLTVPASQARGYDDIVGNTRRGAIPSRAVDQGNILCAGNLFDAEGRGSVYVPLQFWFCRNVGLSLPLIALQYHEVSLTLTIAQLDSVIIGPRPDIVSSGLQVKLLVDYIYLDTDERRRFAQVSHEYLIEQVQINRKDYTGTTVYADLVFNHPVKELIWVSRHHKITQEKQWANFTTLLADSTIDVEHRLPNADAAGYLHGAAVNMATVSSAIAMNPTAEARLFLNGHERFSTQGGAYFNLIQTLRHTRVPLSPGINVYSFAIKPEDHQPSGTCNFSRIDKARLSLTMTPWLGGLPGETTHRGELLIFATNYNVLRIMSGMGGVAYSN